MKFFEGFGVREDPFGVTPDPRFLYLGPSHREALASLAHGVETNRGFMALIAPAGMGKTTLLFRLLEHLRSSAETVFHFQTQCTAHELLRFVLADLGVEPVADDIVALHQQFNRELLQRIAKGRRVVVVLDEAQNLNDDVLEAIRLLSDFETPQKKLMQIVLSGQQQLLARLASAQQVQLRQRISIIARLRPFGPQATAQYIEHRLRIAGLGGEVPFTAEALEAIARHTSGVPRTINNYCFQAMSLAFALGRTQIDAESIEEVARDYELPSELAPEEPELPAKAAVEVPLAAARPPFEGRPNQAAVEVARFDVPLPDPPRAVAQPAPIVAAPVSRASADESWQGIRMEAAAHALAEAHAVHRPTVSAARRGIQRPARRRFTLATLGHKLPAVLGLSLAGVVVWWGWRLPQTSNASVTEPVAVAEPQLPQPAAANEDDKRPAKTRLERRVHPKSEAVGPAAFADQTAAGTNTSTAAASQSYGSDNPIRAEKDAEPAVLSAAAETPEPIVLPQHEAAPRPQQETPAPALPQGLNTTSASAIARLAPPDSAPTLAAPRSSGATSPRLVRKPLPSYPALARNLRITGSVVLRVMIGESGRVSDIKVVSGNPILARSAVEAVREWLYEPATVNGQAVPLETMVTVKFTP